MVYFVLPVFAGVMEQEARAVLEYWMEVDAFCLSELEGMPLEAARAIVAEEHRTGRFEFRGLPADAERLALAGDVLVEGQVVFRYVGPRGVVDVESPVDGVFEGESPGPFAVRRREA